MTAHDFGTITATSTEWATRFTYRNGDVRESNPATEDEAQFSLECVQAHLADASREPRCEKVELVSRERLEFDRGGVYVGPWQVAE